MGRKKKFIDKKKSATFQLLARDSTDPNYDGGPIGDRVFVRLDSNPFQVNAFEDETPGDVSGHADDDSNSIFADAPGDESGGEDLSYSEPKRTGLPDLVRKEILELGFPDDGYNYLTHLREIKKSGGGSAFYRNNKARPRELPLDVKAYDASSVQITGVNDNPKEKFMYNVAAGSVGVGIQKASDPEVAALLNGSDLLQSGSDDEELEEDFVIQANIHEESNSEACGEALDLVSDRKFFEEENKQSDFHIDPETVVESRTTVGVKYCLPEAAACDEKPKAENPLDRLLASLEWSEHDSENNNNNYASDLAKDYEFLADQLKDVLKAGVMDDELDLEETSKAPADVIQRCVEYAEKLECENDDQNVEDIIQESSDESEAWDCETIISTYSNMDNHPGKIVAPEMARKKKLAETVSAALSTSSPVIALGGKGKLPVDYLPGRGKGGKEKKGDAGLRALPENQKRHGQESVEEKKARKAGVREERREARRAKKEMKCLFKAEAQHVQKVAASSCPPSIRLM